ncbi:MAG TPA: pyridoxal phosphate-dependent aminotransferase [Microvirga sp.]|jgi:aspartate/methionine/tyrosine aminotransferase|nr:pyridoxal phosphate-dependent aminotransferase [Microvirga sp.]
MNAPAPIPSALGLRPEARQAPSSGIVEVFNYGRNREGLIPLWVGEGDLPTPAFICEAATRSLAQGETFYTYQRGIPELRQAIARYHDRVYGGTADPERFFVTCGGMHALQLAARMTAGPGDEVLVPTPAWPNFIGALTVAGARPVGVPLARGEQGWRLDIGRLQAAVTPRTRAIMVNTPANPTGWTATEDDQRAILDLARRHGLWIVADEIYGRFVYDPAVTVGTGRAPSFRDSMTAEDRVLFVQTFSKNWAMTGWRLGWLEAPPALGQVIENLVQYSTSGVPVFAQRAGVEALDQGEAFVREQIVRAAEGRALLGGLASTGAIDLPPPQGAFYAFFRVPGSASRDIAIRLIEEAAVGVAPGSAFGEGGEGHVRLCYLRKTDDLRAAVDRMARALAG